MGSRSWRINIDNDGIHGLKKNNKKTKQIGLLKAHCGMQGSTLCISFFLLVLFGSGELGGGGLFSPTLADKSTVPAWSSGWLLSPITAVFKAVFSVL